MIYYHIRQDKIGNPHRLMDQSTTRFSSVCWCIDHIDVDNMKFIKRYIKTNKHNNDIIIMSNNVIIIIIIMTEYNIMYS